MGGLWPAAASAKEWMASFEDFHCRALQRSIHEIAVVLFWRQSSLGIALPSMCSANLGCAMRAIA